MALVCPACSRRFNPYAVRYGMVCRGCGHGVDVSMRYSSLWAMMLAAFVFVVGGGVVAALIAITFPVSGTLAGILECTALIAFIEALLFGLFVDLSSQVSLRTAEPVAQKARRPRRARRAKPP